MPVYIFESKNRPNFSWEQEKITPGLVAVHHRQGRLLGRMEALSPELQAEANLRILTLDILKSAGIDGEILNPDHLRYSLARQLGISVTGSAAIDRYIDGIVEIAFDASQHYDSALSDERLFGWHAALFPTGYLGTRKILIGHYRKHAKADPGRVSPAPAEREKIHLQTSDSALVRKEMNMLIAWFNGEDHRDPIIKAAIAHLWVMAIHPFETGNGRIARAITDMQLCRADQTRQRFYSMSSQISVERDTYLEVLSKAQENPADITGWLEWFVKCLDHAIAGSEIVLADVLKRSRFWDSHVSVSLNDRQRMMLNMLLGGFDGKLTSSRWAGITKCSQDSAGRDINDLIRQGVLVKEPGGGRSTGYGLRQN
jgi:Fic family protein